MTAQRTCLPFLDVPRVCDLCGTELAGRQQRWCADGCDDLYWTNHRWGRAREVALARAVVRRWIRNRAGKIVRCWRIGWRCNRCGTRTTAPEVNHRTPALGAHARESCAHHQENLEVFCRDCHLDETRRQHAAGELGGRQRPTPIGEQLALGGVQ